MIGVDQKWRLGIMATMQSEQIIPPLQPQNPGILPSRGYPRKQPLVSGLLRTIRRRLGRLPLEMKTPGVVSRSRRPLGSLLQTRKVSLLLPDRQRVREEIQHSHSSPTKTPSVLNAARWGTFLKIAEESPTALNAERMDIGPAKMENVYSCRKMAMPQLCRGAAEPNLLEEREYGLCND